LTAGRPAPAFQLLYHADRRDWPDPTLVPCYLLLGESGCCSKRSRETFSRCAPAVAIDHLKSGRLRALSVTSATRWQGLPDVPTVGDVLPGYEATAWLGVGAPKSTPAQIVDKLNEAINAGLADAKLNARLAELGGSAMIGSPADFGCFVLLR